MRMARTDIHALHDFIVWWFEEKSVISQDAYIAQGMHQGELRTDIAPAFTYRTMMDAMGSVQRWFDPAKHSEASVVQGWMDVFLRGIEESAPHSGSGSAH